MKVIIHGDRVSALLFKKNNPDFSHYLMPDENYYSLVPDEFDHTGFTLAEAEVDNLYLLRADYDGYALYRYVDANLSDTPIENIDWKVNLASGYNLKKRITMSNGKISEIIYFVNYDPVGKIFADPVIKIVYNYVFDEDELLTEINHTIYWYLENGSIGPTSKTMRKIFHPQFDRHIILEEHKLIRTRFYDDLVMAFYDWADVYGGFANKAAAYVAVQGILSSAATQANIFTLYGDKTPVYNYFDGLGDVWLGNLTDSDTIKNRILGAISGFSLI